MEGELKTILQLVKKLNDEELLQLNNLLFKEHKKRLEEKIITLSTKFRKGDIVTFTHNGKVFTGVIVKINQKSMGITTLEGVQFKISPTFLDHESNPSRKALGLRKRLFPNFNESLGENVVRLNQVLPFRKD